jgi:hypothetical protein
LKNSKEGTIGQTSTVFLLSAEKKKLTFANLIFLIKKKKKKNRNK